MTRVKDTDRGELLIFKELSWQTVRIEAKSTMSEDLTPLRLITNQARCRITIKKKLSGKLYFWLHKLPVIASYLGRYLSLPHQQPLLLASSSRLLTIGLSHCLPIKTRRNSEKVVIYFLLPAFFFPSGYFYKNLDLTLTVKVSAACKLNFV